MKALIVGRAQESRNALKELGIQYDTTGSAEQAERLAKTTRYWMYLIEQGLPGESGIELCRKIRKTTSAPVLIIGSRNSEAEAVAALDSGADDYTQGPAGALEIESRIKAIARRCAKAETCVQALDEEKRTVTIGDDEIQLTNTEYRLLAALAFANGRAVPKSTLILQAYGNSTYATDDALKVRINALRRKIGKSRIQTVRGYGYKYTG